MHVRRLLSGGEAFDHFLAAATFAQLGDPASAARWFRSGEQAVNDPGHVTIAELRDMQREAELFDAAVAVPRTCPAIRTRIGRDDPRAMLMTSSDMLLALRR